MLLIVVAAVVVWIAVLVVIVGVCMSAAEGDRALQGRSAQPSAEPVTAAPARLRLFA